MIDVNMLPRELTGYVGHVCGLWFGSYFYDYFIDFHEDREIVDDLEFTPSDVDADDWTEDIKRCLEENGWRLDSKIGTDSDDSDLLVFDCVKA